MIHYRRPTHTAPWARPRAASVALFRRLPKIDLHLHLDGAVRPRTILELARARGIPLPARTVRGLIPHVTVGPDCRSLPRFLRTFEVFYDVLRPPKAVGRVAYELCEDQVRDGVRYFETRFAPGLLAPPGDGLRQVVAAALEGLRRGGRRFGVRWGLILCLYRGEDPEVSQRLVRLAVQLRRRGVVGIDLAGDETRHSIGPQAEALAQARRAGLPATIHVGETGRPQDVWEAVERHGARRIGHGVRLAEAPALARRVARRGVVLELCLTSNVQTGVVPSLQDHPLPALRQWGVPVTLNSDDPAVSRLTLSEEYARARATLGLTRQDFLDMLETAVGAAFAPSSTRRALQREVLVPWQRGAWS